MTSTQLTFPFLQQLPREKIQSLGVEMLTTHELLSVILGSGVKNVPVHMLAQRITSKLYEKRKISLEDLVRIKGMGTAKACQILAVLELVERLRPLGSPTLDSADKVLTYLSELRYAEREHIVCLYLNARLQLVHKETLAVGSVNQSFIAPRDIFAVIKHHPVTHLILAHNHPSGNPNPSPEDLEFTKTMEQAGYLLGVEILDHIIVAREKHYSYKSHGSHFLLADKRT